MGEIQITQIQDKLPWLEASKADLPEGHTNNRLSLDLRIQQHTSVIDRMQECSKVLNSANLESII